jgi:hypothetical protein
VAEIDHAVELNPNNADVLALATMILTLDGKLATAQGLAWISHSE